MSPSGREASLLDDPRSSKKMHLSPPIPRSPDPYERFISNYSQGGENVKQKKLKQTKRERTWVLINNTVPVHVIW